MNRKRAAYLFACIGMTISGCLGSPSSDDRDNSNDVSPQSGIPDFSGFSSFSYELTENAGPFFAPAEGVVGNLQINRAQNGGYTLNFSVGDGEGGLVAVPERMLRSGQEGQMLAIFGDVTLETLPQDPENCAAAGRSVFSEAFDWDGEEYRRASRCSAREGISVEDHEALSSLLGDLVGEDGTMRGA